MKTVIRIMCGLTIRYWGIQCSILLFGIAQNSRIDLQFGPFHINIYFGEK